MLLNGLVQLGCIFELESENDDEVNMKAKETDKIISLQYYPKKDKCYFVIAASITGSKTVTQSEITSLMRELSYHSGTWDCSLGNTCSDYFVVYQCVLSGDPLKSAKLVIGTFNIYFEDVVQFFSIQNIDE